MKTHLWLFLLGVAAVLGFTTTASAQTGAAPAQAPAPAQSPTVRIAPAAHDAVQVVDRFMAALAAGNLTAARALLDPGVVVISNAITLGSRDQYLAKQAKADADYLQKAKRQLLRRDARAGTQFAWVVSEKLFRTQNAGKGSALLASETMLLAKTGAGWKIAHIHWSSRPVDGR